jgi:hypothetical protein
MRLAIAACVAVALLFVITTYAAAAQEPTDTGTAVDTKEPAQQPAETDDEEKPWAIEITVDYLSQYFYRGYNVVPKGWIVQPNIDFSYTVYEAGDLSITPHVAGWFNLTEEKGPQSPEHLAEADLFTGVAFGYGNFELLAEYNFQGYPSRYGIDEGSGEVEEVQFILSYDDSAHWPDDSPLAGVFPYAGYYHEIDDHNDDDRNAYVEVGVEPALQDFTVAGRAVTVSFPLTVGLSTDSYYTGAAGHNETLGFYLVGVKATAALGEHWTLIGEVDYLRLESASVIDANDGNEDEVIARVGVSFAI